MRIIKRMRWRLFASISVGVNLVLAVLWLTALRRPVAGLIPALASTNASPSATKTNLVVRRQSFSWQEVESPDFPTYIANLRDIDCPEQTITRHYHCGRQLVVCQAPGH